MSKKKLALAIICVPILVVIGFVSWALLGINIAIGTMPSRLLKFAARSIDWLTEGHITPVSHRLPAAPANVSTHGHGLSTGDQWE